MRTTTTTPSALAPWARGAPIPRARAARAAVRARAPALLARASSESETTTTTSSASTTDRVTLGTSDLSVAATGVGAWAWGDRSGYWGDDWRGDRARNLRAYETLLAGGVDFIDTAEVYGFGKSEELIAEFARSTAGDDALVDPVFATKFAPLPLRWTASAVPDALEKSLARMGQKKIGLYMQHWPGFGIQDVANDAFLEGLCLCYERGLCDAVGVSNFNAARVATAAKKFASRGVPFASNQIQYSLLYRDPELKTGVVQACEDVGVTVVAYSPMAQGLLTGKYSGAGAAAVKGPRGAVFSDARRAAVGELVDLMKSIGKERGDKTPAQVAVNYCMTKGSVPIPGAKDAAQAASVVGCLGWRLSEGEVRELEKAAWKVPASPGAPFEAW